MTKSVLAALALTVILTMPFTTADALTPTCLPSPLPATPTLPTYSLDMYFRLFGDHAVGTIWRQPCEDGSGQVAVLIRLTPVTVNPSVCWLDIMVVQDGTQRSAALSTPTSNFYYCETLTVPTTVVLVSIGTEAEGFDETAAFTLLYNGLPVTAVEIPAAAGSPPPAGPPTLTILSLGCIACRTGHGLGFALHVANPGPPVLVELKTGARLPDGSIVTILGRHAEEVIVPGVTVIPLVPRFVPPAAIPPGTYVIEAAILEPDLGVTISRHGVPLTVLP
jgi:hypothetical protein